MATVILSFGPEETDERDRALAADEAFHALSELDRYLREQLKYAEVSDETLEALRAVRALVPHALLERCWR